MSLAHEQDTTPGKEIFRARQGLLLLLLAFLLGLSALNTYFGPLLFPDIHRQHALKQVIIPHKAVKSPKKSPPITYARKPLPMKPLDLNKASREELMTLPGIGPVLAERIVKCREERGGFSDISEIKEVSGIGEKRYEGIERWIEIRGKER